MARSNVEDRVIVRLREYYDVPSFYSDLTVTKIYGDSFGCATIKFRIAVEDLLCEFETQFKKTWIWKLASIAVGALAKILKRFK